MGIILDKRLMAVAELVREGVVVADVGTDHGLLVCHLVASRKCPRAFACDIAPMPLARARNHILREGLDARILTVQCDGLCAIPEDAVADVVIAGMGGDQIARIILDWPGSRDPEKRFVLQPMSKPDHLRRILYHEGFVLLDEIAVRCDGYVYGIMSVCYTGHRMELSRHFCHTGKFWEKEEWNEDCLAYMRGVHALMETKARGYAASREEGALVLEFTKIAARIRERLEKCGE